jgi:hypothetical protein
MKLCDKHNFSQNILPSKQYLSLLFQQPTVIYDIQDYTKFVESLEEKYNTISDIGNIMGLNILPYVYTFHRARYTDKLAFLRFMTHYMKQSDMLEVSDFQKDIEKIITSPETLLCFIFTCQYFFL